MYNLHNHTKRCHHAKGSDEAYVKAAIKNGYKVIGFSDHAPYIFKDGYYSNFRIELNEAEDYVKSVRSLQEKYKGIIDIKLGFEVEYYPELWDKELEYLKSFDYDYLILGQHFTGNENGKDDVYSGKKTDSKESFVQYINQVIEAVKTGCFTYVCHPDLFNYVGDDEFYKKNMQYFVDTLYDLDIPLEFNFYGFIDNRNYPNPVFWDMVGEKQNKVLIGIDAHKPSMYAKPKKLNAALDFLSERNLKPMDYKDIKLVSAKD